jgi:hypothetical protein
MPTKLIVDCSTNEAIEVELTAEEIAELEEGAARSLAQRQALDAAEKAKAEAKTSALAKLETLGLTEEEAAALIS